MTSFACVFPGQGSQKVGMGKDLFDAYADVRDLFHQAQGILGLDLAKICFEGPDEELVKTSHAQPAIFLISIALFNQLKKGGFTPKVVAGHSLGEITAYVAAESLSVEQGLFLIQERGAAMAAAYPSEDSGMAAVLGSTRERIQDVLDSAPLVPYTVVIANDNCPNQIVISGEKEGVSVASALLKEQGAKLISLNVSGAFHSPLMLNATQRLQKSFHNLQFAKAKIPIVLNRTARIETEPQALHENVSLQVSSPVQWTETIRLLDTLVDVIVEVGPGKVLSGLIRKTLAEKEQQNVSDLASLEGFGKE